MPFQSGQYVRTRLENSPEKIMSNYAVQNEVILARDDTEKLPLEDPVQQIHMSLCYRVQHLLSGLAETLPAMNKRFQGLLELDALQRQRETGISLHHIRKEFLQRLTLHHDGADLDLPASTVALDVSYQQCVLVRL